MSERQQRAWNRFFDEVIEEAKKDLARTGGSSRANPKEVSDDYRITTS